MYHFRIRITFHAYTRKSQSGQCRVIMQSNIVPSSRAKFAEALGLKVAQSTDQHHNTSKYSTNFNTVSQLLNTGTGRSKLEAKA